MFETYRMLGSEHEADLEREAARWHRAEPFGSRQRRRVQAAVGALAIAAALALAFLASGASAAPPIVVFHGTTTSVNPTDSLCGIDGSSVLTTLDNVQVLGDGTFKDESQVVYTFTSAKTGKSVEISNHEAVQGGVPVNNGDGTATVVNTFNGIPEIVKLPNGTVLAADTGRATFAITFDTTTGRVISVTTTLDGPHPILEDGSIVCHAVVPALS